MAKPKVQWLPIHGRAVVQNGVLRYTPTLIEEGENKGQPAVALMKSDQVFESGTVTLRAKISGPDGRVLVGFASGYQIEVFAGLNNGGAAYGISTFGNGRWENFKTAAYGSPPPIGEDVSIKITVNGSQVTMCVQGVEVVRGVFPVRRAQLTILLFGSEPVEAELVDVQPAPSIAFVVMQFTSEFNSLYSEVIAPVCKSHGFTPVRADDIYENGLIIEDISRSIVEAALVIADVTPKNPNVYYEVGYAHGLGKPTILLAERALDALPFDISGFRTIFYDNTIGGKALVEDRLQKHILNLRASTA